MVHKELQGTLARHYNKDQLNAAMRDARAHLWAQIDDLSDAQWQVPYHGHINPVAWEIGHIAWFAEWWTLRGPHRTEADGLMRAQYPARYAGPDHVFDSSIIPHKERWKVALPPRNALYDMLSAQLEATLIRLAESGDSDSDLYWYRLALFHEDLHAEAFSYMRDQLGFCAPPGVERPRVPIEAVQVAIAGGVARVGQEQHGAGFYFDNEKWAHSVVVPDLQVDVTPVSSGAFLRFVEAGGYDTPEFWPGAAGRWRSRVARSHPDRWRKTGNCWEYRWFDLWRPLSPDIPVMHVNAYEAQAYCHWRKRHLLSDAWWEVVARQGAIEWGGLVWEWMRDPFMPYTGFAPDAYRDYSTPWFGSHYSLRGGSCATHPRICHPQYRNFYLPERNNMFVGFRTCVV